LQKNASEASQSLVANVIAIDRIRLAILYVIFVLTLPTVLLFAWITILSREYLFRGFRDFLDKVFAAQELSWESTMIFLLLGLVLHLSRPALRTLVWMSIILIVLNALCSIYLMVGRSF
jgi:hypothetical protein